MSGDEAQVTLRPAVAEDAAMVFQWRNDPFIVERGSSQRMVSWEEHSRWFHETVKGVTHRMFIVLVRGSPAGQVRFDRIGGDTCVISAYMLETYTGRGLGVEAIRRACDVLFEEWAVATIVACVRADNRPAHTGFCKAGFSETHETGLCPANHFTLVLRRTARHAAEARNM